jgi:hypothetical protein
MICAQYDTVKLYNLSVVVPKVVCGSCQCLCCVPNFCGQLYFATAMRTVAIIAWIKFVKTVFI